MVGRRRKLDSFKIALGDEGCEGFCIYGPPGVGKTRLGDECMALAEAAGRAVLRATGERSTSAVPFAGIAYLLLARGLAALSCGDERDSVVRAPAWSISVAMKCRRSCSRNGRRLSYGGDVGRLW